MRRLTIAESRHPDIGNYDHLLSLFASELLQRVLLGMIDTVKPGAQRRRTAGARRGFCPHALQRKWYRVICQAELRGDKDADCPPAITALDAPILSETRTLKLTSSRRILLTDQCESSSETLPDTALS